MLSQAQALTSDMAEVRWLLIEQDVLGIPVPVLVVVLLVPYLGSVPGPPKSPQT